MSFYFGQTNFEKQKWNELNHDYENRCYQYYSIAVIKTVVFQQFQIVKH
jgi:hypothetical protein